MNIFRICVALMIVLVSSASVMATDAIYKVGETNTDSTQSHSRSLGAFFLDLNGIGYFISRDGTGDDHDKLWRTDGTPAGTALVRSLPNVFLATSTTVRAAVKSGNILYYAVGAITGSRSIVRSDGTAAGTYRLADDVVEMADVNGTLYFSTSIGRGLYKTSGSKKSTVKVKDFAGTSPQYFANVSGFLFFNASDGVNGRELWKSDGTDVGTVMVRDIVQAPGASSNPTRITASGGKAYFVPSSFDLTGQQLWVSDGTELGTLMLTNFTHPGNPNADVRHLTDVAGTLYAFIGGSLYANLQMYKSSGTAATTVVADPGPFGLFLPTSKEMVTTVGNTMYFLAGDRAGSSASFVYKISGGVATQVSGQFINAANPMGTGARATAPILAVGNTIYFGNAPDNAVSVEVSALDHNVPGSERGVADIFPGNFSAVVPYDFATFSTKLFFTQDNGATGSSPYLTDGVTTTMLKDINDTTLGSTIQPPSAVVGGGKLFFLALAGATKKFFYTTGTGVTLIAQTPALQQITDLVGFSGGAIFGGQTTAGYGLHFTDGTTPVLIKAYAGDDFSKLQSVGATVYFQVGVNSPTVNTDQQLWKTDGTVAGTVLVKSFSRTGQIQQILNSNGVTFLVASDGVTGLELWRTDGTSPGTTLVKDIHAGSSIISALINGKAIYLLPFSGGVYFTVLGTDFNSISFYKSDGTDPGTIEVLSKTNGLPFGGQLRGVSNNLLYYNNGPMNVYNGTSSAQVHTNSPSGGFADVSGTAFFVGNEGLYKSDGTSSGTSLLLPDTFFSTSQYVSFAGNLYFLRFTAEAGKELWRSNGTEAGTFLVQDLLPGFKDGVTDIFGSVNGALFLSGRNTVDNSELFATLATSTTIARPTVTAQSLMGIVGDPLSVQVQFTGANVSLYSNERPSNNAFGFGYVPGMILNPATGIISGTPTESGFSQLEIFAQNDGGTASAKIDFNIVANTVLDIDADAQFAAVTDGIMTLRYLFGLRGTAVTNGAISLGAARFDPVRILLRLTEIRPQLDVDGNGVVDALTDGLLVIRDLLGLTGTALTQGAIGPGATRTTAAQVQTYLASLKL